MDATVVRWFLEGEGPASVERSSPGVGVQGFGERSCDRLGRGLVHRRPTRGPAVSGGNEGAPSAGRDASSEGDTNEITNEMESIRADKRDR
jgi:hypothetical protein